jgi:hypothetical protein
MRITNSMTLSQGIMRNNVKTNFLLSLRLVTSMKSKCFWMIALTAMAITSCDDNTSYLGTSLTDTVDNLNISADTFNVRTRSIVVDSVLSRNSTGYIGKIKDPQTGAYITGNYMTQFHTMEDYDLPPEDSILSRIDGKIVADSVELRLYYDDFYGDTLNSMKLTAYELAKPVEETKLYYSNYDPQSYIKNNGIKKQKVFTLHDLSVKDSLRALSTYTNNIRIMLNDEYTDTLGRTYNNYGTYILRKYYENKSYFKNSYNFSHHVCPGFYFKYASGLGTMAYVFTTQLNVYFKYMTKHNSKDTTYIGTSSFSGTEEVLQTTNITNDKKTIERLAADSTCTYLKTPSGIFTEMTLPIEGIYKNHENDTINTAKVVLTRINNNNQNDYNLNIPKTLMMIPKDSLYSFFENGDIADSKKSFVTTYSSAYNTYTFSNISGLVTAMYSAKKNGSESSNWNKVVIIPVTTTYNTSGSLTKVVHNMALTSTRLIGGYQNSRDAIKISVIYSKFDSKK